MRRSMMLVAAGLVVLSGVALVLQSDGASAQEMGEMEMGKMMEMPFGGPEDVKFAEGLWKATHGYQDWMIRSDYFNGNSPHGGVNRMYYDIVTVDATPYHVIVKDNFGGDGATIDTVGEAPADYLMAVTVMVQRESGYDADNNDWFYVKYGADGMIGQNDMQMSLAGRVAKGMNMGCIACHQNAGGGDFIFTNDRTMK